MRYLAATLAVLLVACALLFVVGLAFGGDRLTW